MSQELTAEEQRIVEQLYKVLNDRKYPNSADFFGRIRIETDILPTLREAVLRARIEEHEEWCILCMNEQDEEPKYCQRATEFQRQLEALTKKEHTA